MKIVIKLDNPEWDFHKDNSNVSEEIDAILDNEDFEVASYASLIIGENTYELPVEDFYRAFKVFEEIRKDRLEEQDE